MPTPALHATRAAPVEGKGHAAAPRLSGETERFVPADLSTRLERWRRKAPGVAFTLTFHSAAALAFVILWHSMVRDLSAPEGIPVEVVSHVPGEGDAPKADPPPAPKAEQPAPQAASAPAPAPPTPPQPKPDPLKAALDLPAPPPADTGSPEPAAPSPAASQALRPGLAEPPPEPKASATQSDRNQKANASEDLKAPTTTDPVPPPPAPDVLTAEDGETAVAAPSHEPDHPSPDKPSEATEQPAKDAGAHLAAALPLSSLGMPSTFRAMLSSQGTSSSQEYKGVVYGALGRATAAVEDEARRRRLKGQVAVLITLAENGAIEKEALMQSSGSAETDAFALELVRRAAPFPAPPPGTSRSFTPVITVGEEDGSP